MRMKKGIKALFALLFLILSISGALAAEKTNKPDIKTMDNYIAVFDFEVTTGDKGISRPLTESVRREIVLSGKYDVIDRGNMNKILGEQKFQLSGCVAQECIVDAGQLLGVGKIISGTVSIVGKTYYLTLSLISVKTGKIEDVAEDTCRCEIDELLGSTKRLAKKLLGEKVEQPSEAIAKAKAEEEKVKAEKAARARAEEERIRAEQAARVKAEEAERVKAAQSAKAKAEAEAKEKAELAARASAESEAIAKAKAEVEAKAKAEEAERVKAEQIAKARAEEIERLKAEIARAKAETEARTKAEEAVRVKTAQGARIKAEEAERAKAVQIAKAKQDELKIKTAAESDGRFEKLGNGIVRDAKTGLDWYAGPDRNTLWDDAKGWADNLKFDGGDWRMPKLTELKGLYQKGAGSRNMTPLLETTGWCVWSVETSGSLGAVFLDFGNGLEDRVYRSGIPNFKRGFAVRSTPKLATAAMATAADSSKIVASDGRFEKLVSGVVRDTQSGLDWYAGPDKDTSWDDAKSWAVNLKLDGGDWRMPKLTELKGIYQKGAGSRNMTPLLETTGWWVWAGETSGPGAVWTLDFGDGRELLTGRGNSTGRRSFAVRSRR